VTSFDQPRGSPVVVVPYDPAWPRMFDAERASLRAALADLEPDIEHVGSTSVPGLAAKPKIDILVGLHMWGDLASAVERLLGLGYEHEGQIDVPRHLSMKRGRPTTHRVHLVERRGAQWDDVMSFREALRTDVDLRARYAVLKEGLALQHRDDHDAYSIGKAPFIESVIERYRPTGAPTSLIVDYDPTWPAVFERLRARLEPVLAGVAASIEHVGSTAVPGLAAKPIVDMDVVVPRASVVPAAIEHLEALGYVHQGDLGVIGREAFRPPETGPYHHLYVVIDGSPPHRNHIDLRDYLRRRPDDAERYGARKRALAHLLATDREAYVSAKSGIIAELLAQARGL
jgi:GrpB-like predicted nucleotidyltransferase (UPF0157 family)